LGRTYGRDDIVNGRAGGGGGDGFVVDERFVGDGIDHTINTVDRLLQGLSTEHFTKQTAGSATATSFIHYGIQILSQSLIRPARWKGSLETTRPAGPLSAPSKLINPPDRLGNFAPIKAEL
jgi:hypothetical protein